ncbi:MotE family protein [Poseidonibacter lekithochrous]|uniref:MotE family protein n=1 Tax=Poseidonibacter lekithochrous TaxID=1904463 RepID=UPI0008FC7B01|nr:hypothetical protein [Poseidonibacter lekithochrous]QKJ24356.1 hypothetical protein ALEK_3146 [Poseidonibacter lekithochrous]
MIKKVVLILTFVVCSYGQTQDSSYLTKQKIEIKELKKELNSFYNKKEKEYQERKKELETILTQVKREKNNIQDLHDKNLKILQSIEQTVQSKTTKIYNSMKPKIAAGIFDVMISEGKLEDVFDIILKLKERNVTLLMKFLSVQNAAKITEMLENYNINEK